jgi:WD40 repeat protein
MTSSRVAVVSLQDRRFALRTWDLTSGREPSVIALPEGPSAIRFSADGSKVAVADSRGIRILDAAGGRELAVFLGGHTGPVRALAFSPDGESLATASLDKTARVWTLHGGASILTFRAGQTPVTGGFHPDGLRLVTLGAEGVNLWDAGTGRLLGTLRGHEGALASLAVSPDGTRFATGGADRTALIWEAASARQIQSLRGHTGTVTSLCFCPDRTRVLTGSSDKTARLWDGSTGRELLTLRGHTSDIPAAACSPDGRLIATGSADNTARIWDAATGRELNVLRGHDSALRGHGFLITGVAFSPDGAQLLTASVDGAARLWDTASGRLVSTLTGHQHALTSAAFSPDGSRIATASFDKTVRIWDSATGEHRFTLGPYDDRLSSATYSVDGRRLAIMDAQGYVKMHPMDLPSLIQLARRRVTRPLTSRECQTYFHKPACPELP